MGGGQTARATEDRPCPWKNNAKSITGRKGMLAVARECKVGTGTVQRIAREMSGRPFDGAGVAT